MERAAIFAGFVPAIVLLMWASGHSPAAWEWLAAIAGAGIAVYNLWRMDLL